MKKIVISKIPSESITRMPMESLMGKKKMICPRIFLPYEITTLSERKSSIYCTFYYERKVFKNFMYWILGQIIFFFPTRDSIGILVMDSEGIFEITFFLFNLNPALCEILLSNKFFLYCNDFFLNLINIPMLVNLKN